MDERLKIVNNILEITDENKNPLEINDIKLEFSCNKYSSKKNSIYHVILNEKHLSKRNKYNIKYRCVACNTIHIVGTTQFLRKIAKCSHRCNICVNTDENKRQVHSISLKSRNNVDVPLQKPRNLSLQELREESLRAFEEYDDDFKENYYKNHLTDDDYKRISKNIISIQNGKFTLQELEFWSVFKTNNQMLFTSLFYNKANDTIIQANQPILKCDNCIQEWRAKGLGKFKNCYKILCKDCTLCNRTYKIRNTQNCIRECVLYQSQLEYKFISWCNNSGIIVRNGPIIPYDFDGKSRKYRVDFQIDNILIEIKDNHIWQQGIWKAKEDAVKAEIEKAVYEDYYLITPQNWVQSLNKLKKDRLNKI
jgi:hypothetical protein